MDVGLRVDAATDVMLTEVSVLTLGVHLWRDEVAVAEGRKLLTLAVRHLRDEVAWPKAAALCRSRRTTTRSEPSNPGQNHPHARGASFGASRPLPRVPEYVGAGDRSGTSHRRQSAVRLTSLFLVDGTVTPSPGNACKGAGALPSSLPAVRAVTATIARTSRPVTRTVGDEDFCYRCGGPITYRTGCCAVCGEIRDRAKNRERRWPPYPTELVEQEEQEDA